MIKFLKYLFFSVIFFTSFSAFAYIELPKTDSLSEKSFITLITCDPGEELYSLFGHSAVGIVDPEQKLAIIFNYGTFSFKTSFFYLKFASGKLLYRLSFTTYDRFLYEYRRDKRMVTEERLNLTLPQRQRLFAMLKENYKPENREYQYDFFFDNCATRISNIFHKSLGSRLIYTPAGNYKPRTFRNLIDEYLVNSYWSKFGIDIALGAVIDKPATELQITFLPDYLSEYVNYCKINGKPFVAESRVLVNESEIFPSTPWIIRPATILWVVFLIIMALTIFLHGKSWIIGDRIIFGIIGFTGIVVLLLWTATDHDATADNFNLLWANPLYLIYIWFIGNDKKQKLLYKLSLTILAISILTLAFWKIIPQQYNIAFIPIIGIVIIRSSVIALRAKSKLT
jgi:hypothetical protein